MQNFKLDLHWYVTNVEQVVIDALASVGVAAERLPGYPGVWVGGAKIAQVGISCSKWVTAHGFAINVAPDMGYFGRIVPCGIRDRDVTSVACVLGPGVTPPTSREIQLAVQLAFASRFEAELEVFSNRADPFVGDDYQEPVP